MSSLPDDVASSTFAADTGGVVPMTPISSAQPLAPTITSTTDTPHEHRSQEDIDDPIVREINVYISPELSSTLQLLQFPIQSSVNSKAAALRRDKSLTPIEAKLRPKHNMLELDYPIPRSAQGGQRQLSDKMCLSQRTFASNAVAPVTHMALAKLNRKGTSLYVVPMQKHVLQLRPSFRHLHDEEDDDVAGASASAAADDDAAPSKSGKARPVMFQKKESERSAAQRRNGYAYKKASEEAEDWIELEVHGNVGSWSALRKEFMGKVRCSNKENVLSVAANAKSGDADGGYVKSLNYLDSFSMQRASGEGFVENLSEWAPSAVVEVEAEEEPKLEGEDNAETAMMAEDAPSIGATEQATAELASKLAILLQNGNGTMVPYKVVRSRFHAAKVSDDILTMALSSCAVLVRGNFALKSNLAKFLNTASGGEMKKRMMRELRDLILLLLNMHGMVQRERLVRAYVARAQSTSCYSAMNADTITFVLNTVGKKGQDCWVARVDDDEEFAAEFPAVAACHGVFWMKKKKALLGLIELYENMEVEEEDMEWGDTV